MRSAVALESRRAQTSASSMITSAMVSVPIICANRLAFSNQGGTASCFFLMGRSVGDRFGQSLGKGKAWALHAHTSSFPPTSIFSLSLSLRGEALSESPSSPWSWMGLSLQGPACTCWSVMSNFIASETLTCKCLRCLCHSDSNLYITLRDGCIILCSFI